MRRLLEFVAARRSRPMEQWREDEHEEFRRLVAALQVFVFKVGYFATPHFQVIDAAYEAVVADLRSRVGKRGWLISLPAMMKYLSRDLTLSGWLFQELRERIKILTTAGPVSPVPCSDEEEETKGRLDEVVPAFLSLRKDHGACELKNHRQNRRLELQGFCGRGCDVLLLNYLKFHPVLIGRVLGRIGESTVRNRIEDCKGNLYSVQNRSATRPLQNN